VHEGSLKVEKQMSMKVCYFGSYQENYSRNHIIRRGLKENAVKVLECNVPFEAGLRFWKRYARLSALHRTLKNDYDYLFVAEMNHKNMPIAYLLSKIYKKPLIFDPFISRFDSNVNDRERVQKISIGAVICFLLDKLSLKMADLILADTRQHVNYFRDTFKVPQEKIKLLYVGADDLIFDRRRYEPVSTEGRRFSVCFYGTFIPLQGVEYIIKAACLLRKEDIQFVIIGRGQTYPVIDEMIKNLKLSNVKNVSPMPVDDLPYYIMKSDILLGIFGNTAKTRRVIPNKIFQSMAMAKPVVTGDTPAVREILTDSENVLLCKCADEDSLAKAIVALRDNPAMRRKIGEGGYALIQENFTPLLIGKKLIQELGQWKDG
jgi:glycosyltransferase involved in cell wall biosynthesis